MDHRYEYNYNHERDMLLGEGNMDYKTETKLAIAACPSAAKVAVSTQTLERRKHRDPIITFNVSGRRFQTFSSTLARFPNTLLGNPLRRNRLRKTDLDEVFLDRNEKVFQCILTFYQTGIFEQPSDVNQNIFVTEVAFYGLTEEAMACSLSGFENNVKQMPTRKFQFLLWSLLEKPDSSLAAKLVSLFSLLIILISIITFCWETLPAFQQFPRNNSTGKGKEEIPDEIKETVKLLQGMEYFCITWFTLEFVLRAIAAPNKLKFFYSILNIIDLVAILPFYITMIISIDGAFPIYFLRTIRLVRVFRVFKLSRYSGEMKILGIALKSSARELAVLVFFIMLGVLIFSSAAYYAEYGHEESQLQSIPGAFWWSIVTMTTVGYGDEVPKTVVGRLVGAVCAMCGILVIAMPIPIIVNNFTLQYSILKPVSKYWLKFEEKERRAKEIRESNGMQDPTDYIRANEDDLGIEGGDHINGLLHLDRNQETSI